MIVRVEIHLASGGPLGCGGTANRRHAISGAERVVEEQCTFVVLKKRPCIAYLYYQSLSRVFSSDLHRVIEVVNWLGYFGPVACGQGSARTGVEDQANRARPGLVFARIRRQQVPVRTDVVVEQNSSGAPLDGRNDEVHARD